MKATRKLFAVLSLMFLTGSVFSQEVEKGHKEEPVKVVPVKKSNLKPAKNKVVTQQRSSKKISTVGAPKRAAVKVEKE